MDRQKRILFGLLLLKAFASIQSQVSFENDVTKHVDSWIVKVFKVNGDSTKKLFTRICLKTLDEYNYDIGHEIEPFGKTFNFREVYMNLSEYKSPQINWKFSENKMGIFIKEFTVRVFASLRDESGSNTKFDTHLDMVNASITLSITDDEKTSIDLAFDDSWLWYNDDYSIYWPGDDDGDKFSADTRAAIAKAIRPALAILVRENFKRNDDFTKSIKTLFKAYSGGKHDLTSTHPDFFTEKNKCYYLIPKISFFCFNLKNIFIRGLWNLEWIKVNTGLSIFTHTLMIRDVQGSLVLDFGVPQEKSIDLQFKIDYLSISIDRKSVNVDARCYSVNKTNTPLPYRQAALIMQRIESAVANSVFPAVAHRRTYDIDTPVEQIKVDDKSDWNKIKTSFHEWIPFNENVVKPPAGGPGAGAGQTKP